MSMSYVDFVTEFEDEESFLCPSMSQSPGNCAACTGLAPPIGIPVVGPSLLAALEFQQALLGMQYKALLARHALGQLDAIQTNYLAANLSGTVAEWPCFASVRAADTVTDNAASPLGIGIANLHETVAAIGTSTLLLDKRRTVPDDVKWTFCKVLSPDMFLAPNEPGDSPPLMFLDSLSYRSKPIPFG